uniref:Uncharacterized protein n=1 Tax=Cannabis sativa TaxID=3483 RepID=A0A803P4J7_CANSA
MVKTVEKYKKYSYGGLDATQPLIDSHEVNSTGAPWPAHICPIYFSYIREQLSGIFEAKSKSRGSTEISEKPSWGRSRTVEYKGARAARESAGDIFEAY